MAVTASMVKELRERTGAGMMECKKALVETNGDIEVAIDNMRKSGQAKAAKKAGRIAAEGVVVVKVAADNRHAVMLEINSETDFVSRDENFKRFADDTTQLALDGKVSSIDVLMARATIKGETVAVARETLVTKIGENIQIRRLVLVEAGTVGSYIHGGRIGVVVTFDGNVAQELARDVAMHIAASAPEVVSPEQVSADLLNKEREIFTAQAKESGKPDNIIEKMIEGRMKKFVGEVSLVGQPFVKDPGITVGKLLQDKGANITGFTRFEVGEGIEKKEEDFAAEVMAQVKG